MQKLIVLIFLILGYGRAFANLDISKVEGRQVVRFTNVGPSHQEVCVLPKHFAGAAYQNVIKADGSIEELDVKTENQLCAADFHNTAEQTFENMTLKPQAVCPKINSTNPGLDIFDFPSDLDKIQIEANLCKADGVKKIAKYQLSTSCSYTPSILGYYHLSRMLGNILHTPVAVLRTVDQDYHAGLARKALQLTPKGDLIHQTFETLLKGLEGRGSKSFNEKVLTTTHQSYGALLGNIKDDGVYVEFFHESSDRAVAFKQRNPFFKMVSAERPVETIVGKELTKKNLQAFVAMRDLSDMLVIDYLMNQKDRFGNIAYMDFVYFKDGVGILQKTRVSKKTTELQNKPDSFTIKEMALKDNDCGGSDRPNVMKLNGLTQSLRHMHPETYQRILWMGQTVDTAATREFIKMEMLFTEMDHKVFRSNLLELAGQLKSLCRAGKLRLDLDFKQHFQGIESAGSRSCDPI